MGGGGVPHSIEPPLEPGAPTSRPDSSEQQSRSSDQVTKLEKAPKVGRKHKEGGDKDKSRN